MTEQIKTTECLADLRANERKNVYLAVACGALATVNGTIPGPAHQKKKRALSQLYDDILRYTARRIDPVEEHNMALFKDAIQASEIVLGQLQEEFACSVEHVLLNLAGFCMEELPLKKSHFEKYSKLFDLWENAQQYKDVRSGERIFARIDSELEILVAQRGGILL